MNDFALAGFVTSLASLFVPFFGLTPVLGLILSAIGKMHAKYEKSKKGLGIAGMILSIISLVIACAENVFLFLLWRGKLELPF